MKLGNSGQESPSLPCREDAFLDEGSSEAFGIGRMASGGYFARGFEVGLREDAAGREQFEEILDGWQRWRVGHGRRRAVGREGRRLLHCDCGRFPV